MENINLLDNYEELPQVVKDIFYCFEMLDNTYENCEQLVKSLNVVGYTIEYGLDAEPYNLTKIKLIKI